VVDIRGATAYTILVPAVTTYLLSYLSRLRMFNFFETRFVSVFLIKYINLIVPFLLDFFAVYLFLPMISGAVHKWFVTYVVSGQDQLSIEYSLLRWQLMGHVFWLLGIHGANLANSVVDTGFMASEILPGLTAQSFANAFLFIGGG